MKTKPIHMISTDLEKVRERATSIVLWENCPKKESVYPKREIEIDRLQRLLIDYKVY